MKLLARMTKLAEIGISRPWSGARAIAFSSLFLAVGIVSGIAFDFSDGKHELNVFLLPSIVLAAGLGGFVPGVLMTVLALLADSAIDYAVSGREGLALGPDLAFLATGLLMSFGGHLFRQSLINSSKMYAELQQREADLRAIVETVPDSLVVIDHEGVIVQFSPGAQNQFGWAPDEAIGQNVSMLMPSPYREQHQDYIAQHAGHRTTGVMGRSRQLAGLRKDGSTFPIEVSLGELQYDGQHHYVGFIRDLSERREAEARLQELQNELFHVSRLSALGQLASALAHEINQPLSAISNYIAGAKKLVGDASRRDSLAEALDFAGREALRAGETIRKLRGFLSRGESDMRAEQVADVIDEAVTIALVGNHSRKVRLQTKLSPLAPTALVDRVQIQQVLLNLIRNAIEAMNEAGSPRILIETAPADHNMIMFSVTDNGSGMSPEVMAQLFQPFVTSKATGMGIGLSITRSIVEAHGGRIWSEPNPSGGTIFRFTVRAAPGETIQGHAGQDLPIKE